MDLIKYLESFDTVIEQKSFETFISFKKGGYILVQNQTITFQASGSDSFNQNLSISYDKLNDLILSFSYKSCNYVRLIFVDDLKTTNIEFSVDFENAKKVNNMKNKRDKDIFSIYLSRLINFVKDESFRLKNKKKNCLPF